MLAVDSAVAAVVVAAGIEHPAAQGRSASWEASRSIVAGDVADAGALDWELARS